MLVADTFPEMPEQQYYPLQPWKPVTMGLAYKGIWSGRILRHCGTVNIENQAVLQHLDPLTTRVAKKIKSSPLVSMGSCSLNWSIFGTTSAEPT